MARKLKPQMDRQVFQDTFDRMVTNIERVIKLLPSKSEN